jgi:hypothetical protein
LPALNHIMRLVFALIACVGLFKSGIIHAQTVQNTETKVVFDPLFWKDELKLTEGQYNQIRIINEEYYQGVMHVVHEHSGNVSVLRNASSDLLQKRSDRIWNTFHSKQKRKWKEISSSYSNATLALSASPRKKFPG